MAFHIESGTGYVTMHPKGGKAATRTAPRKSGSSTSPRKPAWPGPRSMRPPASPSARAAPPVFAFNTEKASVTGYDGGRKLKAVASGAGFGDTPTLLEVQ